MFKKLTTILALFALCLMAGTSFAAVKTFAKFKVDVPSNWTASEEGPTVTMIAKDKSASISITVDKTNGMSLKDLATAFSKELKGSKPEADDDTYTFTFKPGEGVESKAVIAVDGKEYYLFVITGENDQIEDIMGSIEDK